MNNVSYPLFFIKSCTCFSNLSRSCYVTLIAMRTMEDQMLCGRRRDLRGLSLTGALSQKCIYTTPKCLRVFTSINTFVKYNSPLCRWRGAGLSLVSVLLPRGLVRSLGGFATARSQREVNLCFWEEGLAHGVTASLCLFIVSKWNSLFGWDPAKIYAHAEFCTLGLISLVSVGPQAMCKSKSLQHLFLKISVNRK